MKKRLTALVSSLALAAFSALGVTAFEVEKPESADELSAKTSQTALAAAEVTDPELGILIYKQTFDTDATPTYINTAYDIYGHQHGHVRLDACRRSINGDRHCRNLPPV